MKRKLTIYNTVLMTIMVLLVLIFMFVVSGGVIQSSAQSQLKEVVKENADEIEYERGILDVEDIEFYENQVTTLIYSAEGVLVAGSTQNEIMEPLLDGEIQTVIVEGTTYLIYDELVKSSKYDDVYVRGIIETTGMTQTVNSVFWIALFTLPIFILFSAIGSYLLCKKSLKPLDKIVETAEEISESDDLSLRINQEKGDVEIVRLAVAFDRMMEKLERIMNAEKKFTSDVSHELRTPTTVILAECEFAIEAADEEKLNALTVIQGQGLKIKEIINQLLSLIRLENGTFALEMGETDLSELVQMICEEQEKLLPQHVTLKVEVQDGVNWKLDYSMFSRTLTNLLENSVKYIGTGKNITVILCETEEKILLSVEDDGIGISKENQEKIFDRFYRVDASRTEGESMGLGLSMVKQITELNGGKISVESELGKGSTFNIIFEKE